MQLNIHSDKSKNEKGPNLFQKANRRFLRHLATVITSASLAAGFLLPNAALASRSKSNSALSQIKELIVDSKQYSDVSIIADGKHTAIGEY